ncbi:hypothetical protein THRCLA_20901 [Thraustotheca clavata]|uniref:Uncharacterized protein n=1 Tax=Thraustotheca clavata TaxID=74557 RepID=A0A1W0A296_9STRA|nr:hypothetical protein THRCLA_20901 [Thraustotheca clavata]
MAVANRQLNFYRFFGIVIAQSALWAYEDTNENVLIVNIYCLVYVVSKYEIVVGDPTSIIQLNPMVSALFIIDFWMSVDFVSRVLLHIEQLAYLYLSRTVWMAYGSLSVVSNLLKKMRRERYLILHGQQYVAKWLDPLHIFKHFCLCLQNLTIFVTWKNFITSTWRI